MSFLFFGGLMLLYSLRGKFHHRDRILALAKLRGDEDVLDVGTGRGLLLVGAAKKLVTIGETAGVVSGLPPAMSLRWLRATVSRPGLRAPEFCGSAPSQCPAEARYLPGIHRVFQ